MERPLLVGALMKPIAVLLAAAALAGCTVGMSLRDEPDEPPKIAATESADPAFQRRKDECRRFYELSGDRSLTQAQLEVIRDSKNSHFCGGLVP